MLSPVHIVISDKGWILERLAEELKNHLAYVTYDTAPNSSASIQYYMTYGTYKGRISAHEIGLFTHLEQQPEAAAKFFTTAAAMDVCVAMSHATERLLVGKAAQVLTISPGVDLERFRPKLRIGIIGRTYHTGRKGEDLVAAVQDIEGIEWVFTGEGWPGDSQFVADDELPAFYRSLDYVLVPARIEGGPMCVLEALASGIEVIAPPIGWVPEFPHIEFKVGDAQDLRRVLIELVKKKSSLRKSVETYTWKNWADAHHELFASLVGEEVLLGARRSRPASDMKAVVAVHGAEMTESVGGPSIRAPMTARALEAVGVEASFCHSRAFDIDSVDVVHVMNVWEPDECALLIQQAQKAGKPVVFSPIYLDLSEYDVFSKLVPNIFNASVDERIVLPAYQALRTELQARRANATSIYEVRPGYHQQVRDLIAQADHVVLLSDDEGAKLQRIGACPTASSIVHNPVVSTTFTNASPSLFENTYGVKDYVLCVARIESRKNQLTLAFALRDTNYPLVFIGHNTDVAYLNVLKKVAGPNTHFIGRLEPNSEMLASAFAGARVFCLPSWSEGAPLSALEAGAAGCRMILSNRSSEREYFAEHAWYCDPGDPVEMRALVKRAYEEPYSQAQSDALKAHVRERFNWDVYTRGTRAAYDDALSRHKAAQDLVLSESKVGRILIDLTTLAHRDGPPSGIARTEERLAVGLHDLYPDRVRFIVWNSHFERFLPVDRSLLDAGTIKEARGADTSLEMLDPDSWVPFDQMRFDPSDTVVVFGGAWIRNQKYLRDLKYLKRACGIRLVSTVYDVIQWKFSRWFPNKVGDEFGSNCETLISASDRILTCSSKSRDDIKEFSLAKKIAIPPIDVFRLGDEAASIDPNATLQLDHIATIIGSRNFILYVSAIDVRKNHKLLLDVWERLASKHGRLTPKLILVGSIGWGGEVVVDRLKASPDLRENVSILHSINDVTLEWLYKNCLFTVYPSLYEGWGLPVAESLRLGKFCIASNAGSLPEIAPDITEMLDPQDFMRWYEKIERYAFRPSALQVCEAKTRTYRSRSWTEAAEHIAGCLERVRPTNDLVVLSSGSKVTFASQIGKTSADDLLQDKLRAGGWGRSEKNGSWTIGTSAVLCFRLASDAPVALVLLASAFMPAGAPDQVVNVLINDVVVGVWHVNANVQRFAVELKPDLFGPSNRLIVRLDIREPRAPANFSNASTDRRLLGLHVHSLTIEPVLVLDPAVLAKAPLVGSPHIFIRYPSITDVPRFIAIKLKSAAADIVDIFVDGRSWGSVAVSAGEQVRVLRVGEFAAERRESLLTLSCKSNSKVELVEIGLFPVLSPEILASLRVSMPPAAAKIAHLPWYGPAAFVPLGADIAIGPGSPIVAAMTGGWHNPEATLIWSSGSLASLYLRLPDPQSESLFIEMDLEPYNWQFAAGGEFEIAVLIGECQTVIRRAKPGAWTAEIWVRTKDAIGPDGVLRMTICAPPGIIPARTGTNDGRPLSFMLTRLAIHPRQNFALAPGAGLPITLETTRLLLTNWYRPEPDGVWSQGGGDTRLLLPHLIDAVENSYLELNLDVYAGLLAKGPVAIRCLVNGEEVGNDTRSTSGFQNISLRLPRDLVGARNGGCELVIQAPEGVRPLEIDAGADARALSFRISEIKHSHLRAVDDELRA